MFFRSRPRYFLQWSPLLFFARGMSMSTTSSPHILSVGLAAIDFIAKADHFPQPDEKMRSTSLEIEGGGNAANTACAIARLEPFCQASLVSAVGNDANGRTIRQGLLEMQVKTDYIEEYEGNSPFSYILSTEVDNENTRTIVHQPSSGDMTKKFVKHIPLDDFTAAHFDVRYPVASVELGKRFFKAKKPYSVDVERPRDGLLELLEHASVVICASTYCQQILDDNLLSSAERLQQVIREQAPDAVLAIQTLGSEGSCLVTMGKEIPDGILIKGKGKIPTVSVSGNAIYCPTFSGYKIVDTTGAGDSFQGGFLAALWASALASAEKNEDSLKIPTDPVILGHCLRIATYVAARKIEKPGARGGLPLASEDKFIQTEMKKLLMLS